MVHNPLVRKYASNIEKCHILAVVTTSHELLFTRHITLLSIIQQGSKVPRIATINHHFHCKQDHAPLAENSLKHVEEKCFFTATGGWEQLISVSLPYVNFNAQQTYLLTLSSSVENVF
jgi:hypothetical protein